MLHDVKDEAKLKELQDKGDELELILQSTDYSEQEKQTKLMEYLDLLNMERAYSIGVSFSERMLTRIASAMEVHPTDDAAVDMLYACILVQEFHAMEYDLWRAHPAIERCKDALKMLQKDGHWADCLRYAQTTADSYAEIDWWPEALEYAKLAHKCAKNLVAAGEKMLSNGEMIDLRDTAYTVCLYAMHTQEGLSDELVKNLESDLGSEAFSDVLDEVSEQYDETVVDPVEMTPEYLNIRYELEEKIDEALDHARGYYDYCKEYWMAKRMILRTDYGIRWSSPAMLNPNVEFH